MIRRSLLVAAAAALGTAVGAAPAAAQVPLVPGALSLGAGVELPQGEGATLFKQGLTASAAYRIGIPLMPFAVRAEGGISRFSNDAGTSIAGQNISAGGTLQVLHGGGAVEMTVLPLIVFRGYVVGGASYTRATGDFRIGGLPVTAVEESGVGYSVGAGAEFKLPILPSAGVEVRYKYTPGALGGLAGLRSIPITARITF